MGNRTLTVKPFTLLSSQGYPIHGEVKTLDGTAAHPVVVVSHGFRGHKDWSFWPEVTSRLAEAGFYTVGFNFSRIAAGEADAKAAAAATLSQELEDVNTVINALHSGELPDSQASDRERIGLLGHSRAGGSTIIYGHEHPERVRALAVWNGGAAPQRLPQAGDPEPTLRELAIAEDQRLNEQRFRIGELFVGLKLPALVVQGSLDREQLLEQFQRFRSEAPHQRYVRVEGADHTFNAVHPYEGVTPQLEEALRATIAFLQEKLGRV